MHTPEKFIKQGEGIDVEFKLSQHGVPENLYETICAFLNHNGGHILLGVDDNKNITGIEPTKIKNYINQIISSVNNPNKLSPTFYLSPEVVEIEGKQIVFMFVPESSQVHSTSGKIFDRNYDGDFEISKNHALVTALYQKKQQTFTENKIYPYIKLTDLRDDLFLRVRKLAANNRPNHPWLEMSNLELMQSASLYQKDFLTGQEGFTLAAALLLGKDEVIHSILPAYKTDAILRVQNLDRFDDRDDVRTNLIESYDRLMAFVLKHLPDKFYEEHDAQRKSIRSVIFHEVIVNLLGHREFTNPFPAKFIIEANNVRTENWNKPHGFGIIDPSNFTPHTKNPNIARFFREIGRFEELGSGVRNIFKYTHFYSNGKQPQLTEGDIFKLTIPLAEIQHYEIKGAIEGLNEGLNEGLKTVLIAIKNKQGIQAKDISVLLNNRPIKTIERQIKSLVEKGYIEHIGSRKTGGYQMKNKELDRM